MPAATDFIPSVTIDWARTVAVVSGSTATAQNPQASVWWGGPQTLFMQAAEEGLLQPFTPSWADAVPASAKDPEGRWYGAYLTPLGLLYNTEAVDPADVPADWDGLLDPAWADRLLIRSPRRLSP